MWKLLRLLLCNQQFARTHRDHVAIGIFMFGPPFILLFEGFLVLPHYCPSGGLWAVVHWMVMFGIYFNTYANVYRMIRVKTAFEPVASGAHENSDWKYCERCSCWQPPRTHHCSECDACILRRDHHCWFTGYCVGHANHRYHLCSLLYMALAAIYSNVFHFSFVYESLGHLGNFTMILCIMMPHYGLIFSLLSVYDFLIASAALLGLIFLALFPSLLCYQLALTVRGQTQYEQKHGIRIYDNGILYNLQSVLGHRWYLVWLSPWLKSNLPDNGVEFKIHERKVQ